MWFSKSKVNISNRLMSTIFVFYSLWNYSPYTIVPNLMDKGAYNSIYYQYYGHNSNMTSSVTMHISSLRATRMYRMDHHFIVLYDETEASFEEKATES